MKIYIICRPCDDSYYPGHPTNLAFSNKEEVEEVADKMSPAEDFDPFYVHEVELKL